VEGLEGRGEAQPRPHVLADISSGGESLTERGVAGGPPCVSFRPVPPTASMCVRESSAIPLSRSKFDPPPASEGGVSLDPVPSQIVGHEVVPERRLYGLLEGRIVAGGGGWMLSASLVGRVVGVLTRFDRSKQPR